jgi:hypothetical protein
VALLPTGLGSYCRGASCSMCSNLRRWSSVRVCYTRDLESTENAGSDEGPLRGTGCNSSQHGGAVGIPGEERRVNTMKTRGLCPKPPL